MNEVRLDCRGLACPNPVLRTKELVERTGAAVVEVLVDDPAAQENVSRYLSRAGFQVEVTQEAGALLVRGVLADRGSGPAGAAEQERRQKILVLLGCDRLGRGDDELGGRLLENFLGTLKELGPDLWVLVLVNAGVKLAVSGSPVLALLRELADGGVMVLVCGTCLNHFGLLEEKAVGETTNMLDIVSHMHLADKVLTFT
jgi:selenium metabolism protein YedF